MMNRLAIGCSAIALCAAAPAAHADRLAVGATAGWQQRADFGESSRASFVPELVGAAYLDGGWGRLYLRPGLRFGYAGLEQPEMPQSVQVREYDFATRAELGIVHDGPVIPSFTLGAGAIVRAIDFSSSEPIASGAGDPISRMELLPEVYGRVGLGLPLARGSVLIEPFLGYAAVFRDRRSTWFFGIDATVAVF